MLEFFRSISESEDEFIMYSSVFERWTHIPKQSGSKELSGLEKKLRKLNPATALSKIKLITLTYGGKRVYIPKPESFARHLRNEKILSLYDKGFTMKELSAMFGIQNTALRKIVKNRKKSK